MRSKQIMYIGKRKKTEIIDFPAESKTERVDTSQLPEHPPEELKTEKVDLSKFEGAFVTPKPSLRAKRRMIHGED